MLIIICDITTIFAKELLGVISPNPTVDELTKEKYSPSMMPILGIEKAHSEIVEMYIYMTPYP